MSIPSHAPTAARGRIAAFARRTALGLALLTLLGSNAMAQTFYVWNAQPCAAAPDGSELAPYCSIAAAMAAHSGPGVTIIVKPGVYRELVTINASGLAGSPYVLQAQGPGVVIEGADDFANAALWAPSLGGAWLASSVTVAPAQVFADGARLASTTALPGAMPANSFRWATGEGLYVRLNGDSPALHGALVGKRNYGFNIFNKSFVTVDGFEVQHTEMRGIYMQNTTSDLVISNNTVRFAGSYGIQAIFGQRNVITGNKVSDSAFHGIGLTAGTTGCTISNNESWNNADPAVRRANGIFLSGAPGNTLFGNSLHHNQDTGMHFSLASNNCVSYHNCSWLNGDHGFDHLGTSGTHHVNDIAYGNHIDGFSFEGNAPNSSVHNSIAVENGIGFGGNDLWVDLASSVGFTSDHNIFWNSTAETPIKYIATAYPTLAMFQTVSGQDMHSRQADPLFVNPAAADFHVVQGSPAIDAAHSGVANWPSVDLTGMAPVDVLTMPNTGEGLTLFGDLGLYEFFAPAPTLDHAPVVAGPNRLDAMVGIPVSFTVTAADADGDPITSWTLSSNKGALTGASFVPNATNTSGIFTWTPTVAWHGNIQITFTASNALSGSATTSLHFKKKLAEGEMDFGSVALSQGYPNPSASAVDFALDMPEDGQVDWAVYDMQGRRVYSESSAMAAGRHTLRWDGMTLARQRAGTGIYFIRASVAGTSFVRRIVRF